jgi:hypothetical protein
MAFAGIFTNVLEMKKTQRYLDGLTVEPDWAKVQNLLLSYNRKRRMGVKTAAEEGEHSHRGEDAPLILASADLEDFEPSSAAELVNNERELTFDEL